MQHATNTSPRPESPVTSESGFTRSARHFFRWYRNGPIRAGHPALRKLLRTMMPRHQRIVLRSGLKLELDLERVVQHTIFWYDGDMEPQLSWAVREFLPVGGTLIDCGANCGFIGLEARLHKHARVMLIEPHPELAAGIRRNVEINGWKNSCQVIEAAASDQTGSTSLFVCQEYDGSHSLLSDWWPHPGETKKVEVKLMTLRELLNSNCDFAKVDFLKVDTEGHDLNVLKGLGDLLVPNRIPVLYAELGREREAACALLQERGYAGFSYAPQLSGRALRQAVKRSADGQPVAFFQPLNEVSNGAETLWCAKDSAQAARLAELAEWSRRASHE
ncbi:MAG: FkbM family methyltransferase [Verrucomicrobia bacterium]|nr:FkbM family methyltransferase [Verrucomicrobiota bacterium]